MNLVRTLVVVLFLAVLIILLAAVLTVAVLAAARAVRACAVRAVAVVVVVVVFIIVGHFEFLLLVIGYRSSMAPICFKYSRSFDFSAFSDFFSFFLFTTAAST